MCSGDGRQEEAAALALHPGAPFMWFFKMKQKRQEIARKVKNLRVEYSSWVEDQVQV